MSNYTTTFKHKVTGQLIRCHDFMGEGEFPENKDENNYIIVGQGGEAIPMVSFWKIHTYINQDDPTDTRTFSRHGENYLMNTKDFVEEYAPVPEEDNN